MDSQRRLTSQGRVEVATVGDALEALDLDFDVIASSPLSRAKETAEIVAKALKPKRSIELWDELKPESSSPVLRRRLASLRRESTVLIVGHEPGLTGFVAELTGSRPGSIVLKKAGLMRVHVVSFSPGAKAELRWLLSPKVLKRLAG
ncbi:MAG TPA: phosphohistidine phosphatase SixA, partial [Nitrososphaerales archaeon]|nr:phosphohistidine phosphatase SixA [Nitrososphaerales archaeon]